jgi:hypothetical protein
MLKVIALRNLRDDGRTGVEEATSLLTANGFRVVEIDRRVDPVELDAIDQTCDVKMYIVSPHGWHRNLLHEIAGSLRLRFIYDGSEYADQPVWLYYQWWQMNNLVGRRLPAKPVLGVVESNGCEGAAIHLTQADNPSSQRDHKLGFGDTVRNPKASLAALPFRTTGVHP